MRLDYSMLKQVGFDRDFIVHLSPPCRCRSAGEREDTAVYGNVKSCSKDISIRLFLTFRFDIRMRSFRRYLFCPARFMTGHLWR